jgi:hypothetical protein
MPCCSAHACAGLLADLVRFGSRAEIIIERGGAILRKELLENNGFEVQLL